MTGHLSPDTTGHVRLTRPDSTGQTSLSVRESVRLSGVRQAPSTQSNASVLLTLQAASALLGVPTTTLRDWVFRQVLPVVKVPGCRRWWLRRSDVLQLVERHTEYWS